MAIENINEIITLIGLDADKFNEALNSEESIKLEIPDVSVFSKDDLEKRERAIQQKHYQEGKTAQEEMLVKQLKEKTGLEVDGKNFDVFLSAYSTKILSDSKIEIEPKLKEKEEELNKFKLQLAKTNEDFELFKTTVVKDKERQAIDQSLFNAIPEKATEKFNKNEIKAMFSANGYSTEMKEGRLVVAKDGKAIENDRTLEPEPIEKVMEIFLSAKGLFSNEGGRGKGDDTGNHKAGSLEGFNKRMENTGVAIGSSEYNNKMMAEITAGTLKP